VNGLCSNRAQRGQHAPESVFRSISHREEEGVEKVAIPSATLVEKALPRIDYADAYCVVAAGSAPELAQRMLRRRPRWARSLLLLRDWLVRRFGIAPAAREPTSRRLEPGACVGPFHVLAVSNEEVLFGQDDRHLDFRVSLLARGGRATLSTVVCFHGSLGRAYFCLVRPFHRRLARALLAAAIR